MGSPSAHRMASGRQTRLCAAGATSSPPYSVPCSPSPNKRRCPSTTKAAGTTPFGGRSTSSGRRPTTEATSRILAAFLTFELEWRPAHRPTEKVKARAPAMSHMSHPSTTPLSLSYRRRPSSSSLLASSMSRLLITSRPSRCRTCAAVLAPRERPYELKPIPEPRRDPDEPPLICLYDREWDRLWKGTNHTRGMRRLQRRALPWTRTTDSEMRMVAKAGCGMAGVRDEDGVVEHRLLEGERRYIRDAKVVVEWVSGATAAERVRQTNAVSPKLAVSQQAPFPSKRARLHRRLYERPFARGTHPHRPRCLDGAGPSGDCNRPCRSNQVPRWHPRGLPEAQRLDPAHLRPRCLLAPLAWEAVG